MDFTAQLQEIASQWLDVLSDEYNLIPLIFGLSAGLIVSLCPRVQRMNRVSDKKFWTYLTNIVVSMGAFIAINIHKDLMTVLSMVCFVGASSVAIPWLYFEKWRK